ncbi:hypothetical protein BSNK01_04090 [Bacillaceae bacterium]
MMEINLLPKEPFVVKHFRFLVVLVLLFLLLLFSLGSWLYLQKVQAIAGLRTEVEALREEKRNIEERLARNREVAQANEKLAAYHAYRDALARLQKERIPWQRVLEETAASLPREAFIFDMQADGKRLRMKAAFYDLTQIASFMSKLQASPHVANVYVQLMNRPEEHSQIAVVPQDTVIAEFAIYVQD